jgi:tetratricopeptide (TPR) repeat protein
LLLSATNAPAEPLGVDATAATVPPADQIPEVKDAVERFKVQDFAGALKLLEAAVKKHADLPPAQIIMAQLFAQASLPGGVRNALERAVIDAPGDPEAYVILGDIAVSEARVTEADLLYTKSSSLLAAFKGSEKRKGLLQPRVLNGQARVAEARADWAAAQKLLEAWLKVDPKEANVMQRLARALFLQSKAGEAYNWLKKAKETDPNVLTPEAQLAQLYEQFPDEKEREKNHAEAKKWMADALKKAPKDLKTRLVAAQWALENGDIKEAKDYAAAAMQINDKSLDAMILRGVVDLFLKDYKGAERYFEAAHIQSPSNFAASNNLALALVEQDAPGSEEKKNRALEYAENNARAYPRLAEAASTYGWVLYKKGRTEDAERALRAAASSGNISPDTAYYLAVVSSVRNRPEEAKQLLKAALDTRRPFSKKDEAQALLAKMEKAGG